MTLKISFKNHKKALETGKKTYIWRHYTQHNDTQHKAEFSIVTLSIMTLC
jgi:hypothetical protein